MSGPSLKQLHAHHAIHEGALSGAVDKTEEIENLLRQKEYAVAKDAAYHLLDYWQTRIISHADAEEEGFYQEMATLKPKVADVIPRLTRDHDLLRTIAADVKELLDNEGLTYDVMKHFHALLIVNSIHSRDEEHYLLKDHS